eukprot:CAMPEP_0177570716 /NCGR_PEP_ID=MMETSP0369-20130122/77009_1 /TAXON_ID=447022 ORGANISM="Scrippsiella hangoei-like, Strain SHHI-4" /NCGR_SAMPLE_ID=MMETSP0369 /ASSEMBLY_ACC=CAM_ASM_000364 /LENGTH=59 /DNA_ID=CAMNT_0019058513 /DNA_START=89 /DNA_END=269 /DNA_ORIENTATION=-
MQGAALPATSARGAVWPQEHSGPVMTPAAQRHAKKRRGVRLRASALTGGHPHLARVGPT